MSTALQALAIDGWQLEMGNGQWAWELAVGAGAGASVAGQWQGSSGAIACSVLGSEISV